MIHIRTYIYVVLYIYENMDRYDMKRYIDLIDVNVLRYTVSSMTRHRNIYIIEYLMYTIDMYISYIYIIYI